MVNVKQNATGDNSEDVSIEFEPCNGFFALIAKVKNKTVMVMQCIVNGDELTIHDIEAKGFHPVWRPRKNVNKGYGSKLMGALFGYAKEHNIHRISGYLSFNDILYKERLHAFYTKHGFNIVEYDEVDDDNYYGEIEKVLK